MKEIISALVENKAGVLSRMAGLFARRGFNIASLAVGETDDPTVSRMTIVAEGDERTIEQIEKQLNKQIDVIKVRVLEHDASTRRELILIKINAAQQTRGEIIDIAAIMHHPDDRAVRPPGARRSADRYGDALRHCRDRAHWHDCPAKRGRRYRRAITRRLI